MINTGRIAFCIYFFTALFSFSSYAQSTSSPYSRYGIGDINSNPFARNLAMGGTEIGLSNAGYINYGNPASYSSLVFTTYEGGSNFTQYKFESTESVHKTHNYSVISYFDFAFPITPQKWSVGFGLEPYSKVGYTVKERFVTDFGDNQVKQYEGEGGLNNFHVGTGFKIGKKFSAGFNVEYLFGTIDNVRQVIYENPYYMNTSITSNTSVSWFHFRLGAQYRIDSLKFAKSDSIVMFEKKITQLEQSLQRLVNVGTEYEKLNSVRQEIAAAKQTKDSIKTRRVKSDWRMNIGLVGSPMADLHSTNTELVNSFRYFSYANPGLGTLYRDTVVNEKTKGNIRLPLNVGIGLAFVKGSKWTIATDFTYQQWTDFSFLGASDSLDNSWKVAAGLQYTPNDRAVKSYHKTVQYRLGGHYQKGYIVLNDQTINELGVSAGFALPIKKGGTMLHFTFEMNQRGTTKNDLLRERYYRLTFGWTINDRWFVQKKYD